MEDNGLEQGAQGNAPMDLEAASALAAQMFAKNGAGAQPEQVGDDGGEASDISDIPESVRNQQLPEDAQQTQTPQQPEYVAQMMQEMQMMRQQMSEYQQQNRQLQGIVEQLSQKNEQNVLDDAMPDDEPPVFDFNEYSYSDEAEQRDAQAEYAQKMGEWALNKVLHSPEISALRQQAEQGRIEHDKRNMFANFDDMQEMRGYKDKLPQIEQFLTQNSDIFSADAPMEAKYIIAKAVMDGVDAYYNPPTTPAAPSVEELMSIYNNNADFRNAVEQQRINAIKNSKGQHVPPMAASTGAVNAALDIPETPKNLEESDALARKLLGFPG